MNLKKTYISLTAALCLLGGLAVSCTQDNLVAGSGTTLPPGKYPLQFTASVGERVKSRSACKDEWKEGDTIAVRIGDYPVTGSYMLNADGSVKKSINALAWLQPDDSVKAWYPYVYHDQTLTKSLTDQSDGLVGYDLLSTDTVIRNYKETVDFEFKHRMSKVIFKLTPGDGISLEEFATVRLSVNGFTAANFNQGRVTPGGENDWLKSFFDAESSAPDCSVFEAIVVPQDMKGKDFFKVDLKVNVNGHILDKSLTYKADAGSGKLEAGHYSIYNVVVRKDRLEVNPPVTASWIDDREPGASQLWKFKVVFDENFNIPKESRNNMVFSSEVVNAEAFRDSTVNYLVVAGNEFSINTAIDIDKEISLGMRMMKSVEGKDNLTQTTETVGNQTKYTFNFRLRSNEVKVAYKEYSSPPDVGDFYFSDGTWGSSLSAGKTCIGIVIKALECKWWEADGMMAALNTLNDPATYDFNKFVDNSVHGYVLALTDAGKGLKWAATKEYGVGAVSRDDTSCNGYYNTAKVLNTVADINEAPSFQACRDYEGTVPSSPFSSGWYLPSVGQCNAVIANYDLIQNKIIAAGGTILSNQKSSTVFRYWTSSEDPNKPTNAWTLNAPTKNPSIERTTKSSNNGNVFKVRAVLTF